MRVVRSDREQFSLGRAAWRRWPFLLACMHLGLLFTGLILLARPPLYEVEVRVRYDLQRYPFAVQEQVLNLALDLEARDLWTKVTTIDPTHIHPGNKKDNFWEMGDTGPCGPCSEIHIDRPPDRSGARLINAGDARVIEIWNLVFIQFNRGADGRLTPLPARHVDTGMGLERVTSVLQGVASNYDTDLFQNLIRFVESHSGRRYGRDAEDRSSPSAR